MNKTKIDWADTKYSGGFISDNGYKYVHCANHPYSHQNHYIAEHRLVMENYLKRYLDPGENIHHVNGNRLDNRIENMQLISNSDHRKYHMSLLSEEQKRGRAKWLNQYSQSIKLPRELVPCACGCGATIVSRDNKGRLRRFAHGHNSKNMHWKWGGKAV